MTRLALTLVTLCLFLAGCAQISQVQAPSEDLPPADKFEGIVARLAPVVRDTCEAADIARNCEILLYVGSIEGGSANAFQSVDRLGRPFVLITPELIEQALNADEVAFVLAHEAAHHIQGHIDLAQANAAIGAEIFGDEIAAAGGTRAEIREARQLGAFLGQRVYSKDFEFEADALGALITQAAGYDAEKGVRILLRLAEEPQGQLATHPANAQRLRIVRDAVRNGRLPASTGS